MPTPCQHFALLQRRIDELSQKFIDDQVEAERLDPTTFQPDLDRLAAYRLLVHAELEDFLEAKAKERLAAITALISSGSPWIQRYPEVLLLAIAAEAPAPSIDMLVDAQLLLKYVNDALLAARKAITDNNGIKARSFVFLSICAGKAIDEIDQFLSGSLNSYGKDRGDVAHKSVTHSTSLLTPSVELATARALVQQLAVYFDVCP